MKIIITESQYKMLLESNTESIQNLIDMAFQALKDDIGNYFFNVEHIEDAVDATEKIEVVDVQKVTSKNYFENKENSSLFVTIDVYVSTIFETMDVSEMIWEVQIECEKLIGKNNIRIKIRDVINTNTIRQW